MSRGPLQSDGGVDRQRQVVGGDLAVGAGEAVSHGRGSGWDGGIGRPGGPMMTCPGAPSEPVCCCAPNYAARPTLEPMSRSAHKTLTPDTHPAS